MTATSAHDTMHYLGKFSKLHFVDLSPTDGSTTENFLTYKKKVVDCGYLERKLTGLKTLMEKNDIPVPKPDVLANELKVTDVIAECQSYISEVESELDRHLKVQTEFSHQLSEQNEFRHVLKTASSLPIHKFESGGSGYGSFNNTERDEESASLLSSDFGSIELGRSEEKSFSDTIYGVITMAKRPLFERMLFRVTRGNVITRFEEISEPLMDTSTNEKVKKMVFSVVFLGEQLKKRISKICSFFGAKTYSLPRDPQAIQQSVLTIQQQIVEYKSVLAKTKEEIVRILSSLAWSDSSRTDSPYVNWLTAIRVEMSINTVLKKCGSQSASNLVRAEAWVPSSDLDGLSIVLEEAYHATEERTALKIVADHPSSPPSYFHTNKFTSGFQGIVDTYGVPRYKEINPGLFTCATFPFLFGVMYGDMLHGTCMTIFAIFLLYKEKEFLRLHQAGEMDEIFRMVFEGRYMIFCMGLAAMYCGSIYNDCASIPLAMFDSQWDFIDDSSTGIHIAGRTFPYGVDYQWYHTTNSLTFFNSLKMKLSVTLGVTQMTFGIFLSAMNHIYFGNIWAGVIGEFIPRLTFMMCTFGYMIWMVVYKFTIDWEHEMTYNDRVPPNLVQTMTQMFLKPGTVDPVDQLYEGQASVQLVLLFMALISVPWMLLFPPMYTNHQHKQRQSARGGYTNLQLDDPDNLEEQSASVQAESAPSGGGHGHGSDENYDFGDHMIHQAIHTIEFVLGTVSNTASYLRLWALSLAHAELAEVFWEKMVMQYGLGSPISFGVVIGFAMWAGATFMVLMCMDVLECFLHALRLHWVEFQNKFFNADGYSFNPFDLQKVYPKKIE